MTNKQILRPTPSMLTNRAVIALGIAAIAFLGASAVQAQTITEFRLRGPNGANDEFIRVSNETNAPVTVAASSGGGWAIAASDGVVRCTVPNGTVLPAGGSFLCANSSAYSLGANPSGTPNATYTADIADNAGIALSITTAAVETSSWRTAWTLSGPHRKPTRCTKKVPAIRR